MFLFSTLILLFFFLPIIYFLQNNLFYSITCTLIEHAVVQSAATKVRKARKPKGKRKDEGSGEEQRK